MSSILNPARPDEFPSNNGKVFTDDTHYLCLLAQRAYMSSRAWAMQNNSGSNLRSAGLLLLTITTLYFSTTYTIQLVLHEFTSLMCLWATQKKI